MTTADQKSNILEIIAKAYVNWFNAAKPENKWTLEPAVKYFEEAVKAREMGKPVVWGSFVSQPEIFWAMDMFPLTMENFSFLLALLPGNMGHKYIDIAERHHMADHLCSYNKTMMGLAFSGDIPKPDIIVHPLQPCDSGRITYSNMAEILGVPAFAIDIPLLRTERGYSYVADEFERMVSFLEEHTGRKLTYEKLKEAMEWSNRAYAYYFKADELKKNVPCPLGEAFIPPFYMAGRVECAEYAERLYGIGQAKVEKGEGFLREEKIRLGWFSTGAYFDMGMQPWIRKEFGASIVHTMLGSYPGPIEDISTTRKIFEGLARQLLELPMARETGGLAEGWMEYAIRICREYKLDAVFLTLNMGCKNAWALAKLLKDEIADRVGIPTLILEMDALDSRVVSSESIRSAITNFFNTILA
jgi:hypothetical protein